MKRIKRSDELLRDVEARQRNVLPHDVISKDHLVEDVFWNGPKKGSRVQVAGALLIGGALLLMGGGMATEMCLRGSWPEAVVTGLLGCLGGRTVYKAFKVGFSKETKPRISSHVA